MAGILTTLIHFNVTELLETVYLFWVVLVIELRPMSAVQIHAHTYHAHTFFLWGVVCTSNPRTRAESGEWITEFKASLVVGQPGLCSEVLCSICFVYAGARVQLVMWK